jgi:2-dehydro-3-deoxygluconokinase
VNGAVEVATLGEALVVMDPVAPGRLRHVEGFRKRVGGAELNVAVALARLGHRASWSGALGGDEFGAEVLAFLRAEGVDASGAFLDPGSPTGVYFKERRALGRLGVYYYRSGSAASLMLLEDLDVDRLLSAEILHLTGITPALSEGCRNLTRHLMEAARERGVTVSFDANVRFRLFEGRDPREVLSPLVGLADLLFLSEAEAELLLGGRGPTAVERARARLAAETVVVHGRDRAFAVDSGGLTDSAPFSAAEADPVGAGDAFVAGYLSGRLRGLDAGHCLKLANACGACAVTVPGDAESMPFREDVAALVGGPKAAER